MEWTRELIKLIQECKTSNEGYRFGQLLYGLVFQSDTRNSPFMDAADLDKSFADRLFYIEDHELVKILKEKGN